MDCPIATKYQSALAGFSAQNQQRILQYLALLATRHSAATTLAAVGTTLNALRRQLPGARQGALTEDLTQTTAQDIVAFITAAQASGLAPSTINTKLGLLTAFSTAVGKQRRFTGVRAGPARGRREGCDCAPRHDCRTISTFVASMSQMARGSMMYGVSWCMRGPPTPL